MTGGSGPVAPDPYDRARDLSSPGADDSRRRGTQGPGSGHHGPFGIKNLSSERTVVLQSRAWLLPAAVALAKSGAVVGRLSCDVEVASVPSRLLDQVQDDPVARGAGPPMATVPTKTT
jgi:hypothetical protein